MTQQSVDAALQSAVAHQQAGRFAEAQKIYRQILLRQPNHPTALHLLGVAALQTGHTDEALELISKALEFNLFAPEFHNNLGNVFVRMNRFEDALNAFRRAVALRPNYTKALSNMGNALRATEQYDAAIAAYLQALAISPDYAEAHWNLALLYLLVGDYERGWKEYEWRLRVSEIPRREFPQPRWDGNDLDGKTILIHAEGGFGDAIQFVRYIPLVAARGGRVILQCRKPLKRLCGSMPQIQQFVGPDESLPEFDVYCPLFSLPFIFRTTQESIPADVPYLRGDGSRKLLSTECHVGLAWAGSNDHKNDLKRSIRLQNLSSLAEASVTFHSLQIGPAAAQIYDVPELKLIDHSSELKDYADTAALIEVLDLVIAVDTSIAHLAGAMGKPVWALISTPPEWRWMLHRSDSPWYPTMRIFRQETRGDWTVPIREIASALRSTHANRT